ncbi:hypothetical protein SynPROS71_01182 [Synechococcus sp. PROS-7-1]|nr:MULTISPECIES: hypothetical protein [unclassified Synechococcus]MCB4388619.1 hypothetical protein [Synechococcus sp. MU1617]QNI67376.1 hypothetical protein SynBMKMC1_01293 [Synechococcus sp. BMK-MC-1]QNI84987.1 hypothetical protein SynPROS71_01182 [Synechococcus sp. PROS-7-1]
MVSKSRPHNSSDRQGGHQRLGKPGYDSQKVQAEIRRIPEFLEAIGIKASEVCLTLYGGDGGNWHWQKVDGATHCRPVDINLIQEQILDWSIDGFHRQGHQLGFYPMFGGSTKAQSQGSPCLKVECDMLPKDQQLAVLRAFEHTYDVRFTIVDTGGKSLHAYLSINEVITVERYQLVCRCFHERLVDVARIDDIHYKADDAVSRITQAMRLPGAIHKKTGEVATVLQLGKQCSLEQIECGPKDVDDFRKESTTRRAVACTCTAGRVLGYEGDEAMQILATIAQVWDKRIPGEATYPKVLPLVANLTSVLGAEQAAQLLYDQGHYDKVGEHDLKGLLEWCSSFVEPVNPADATARLISMAATRYGWERPRASTSIVADPATELINSEEELRATLKGRSILTNCRTGKGKSKQALGEAVDMHRESRQRNGDRSKFSVGCISPRRTINAQNAQITGGRDVSTGRGSLEDFYIACLQSWGLDHKRHGNELLWRDGVMPAAGLLIIDELRQVMEAVLLGKAGPGEFWGSPGERVETFCRLVWTIRNAAQVYGMDAQLGAPEIDFINSVREVNRSLPVIGNPREENGGVFRWTNKQNIWRAALLETIQDADRTKPVLVVTGAKGEEKDDSTRGISAWALKRFIEIETAEEITSPQLDHPVTFSRLHVVVIDSLNKDETEQRKILMEKDMGIADVVIVTPVAQSGFSFIGDFHQVGFVAGGLTLPPNCVSQGARRERTLGTCYGYLPRTEVDQSCPFFTSDPEENAKVIHKALLEHDRDINTLGPVEELMIATSLAYYERSITELALFTDYALAYLHQDGWTLEALGDFEHGQRGRKRVAKVANILGMTPFEELSPVKQLILKGLIGLLNAEEVAAIERKAVGGGLVDLVGANAAKVVDLLQRSGLVQLCDGTPRPKNDPQIVACGQVLQSPEAIELFKRSSTLQVRASRSKHKAANAVKAIGVIVKQLGGQWKRCGDGRSKILGELPLPKQCR